MTSHDTSRTAKRLVVCTLSTKIGKTTENFLFLCKKLGHDVYVLGRGCPFPSKIFGQPWRWRTRMYMTAVHMLMTRTQDPYHENDLIICCDSGDLLIVDTPQVMKSKYQKIVDNTTEHETEHEQEGGEASQQRTTNTINWKTTRRHLEVVMGVERGCCSGCPDAVPMFDKRQSLLVRRMAQRYHGVDVTQDSAVYPNAGFVMGTFADMLQLFQLNASASDDQMGLRRMLLQNPNLFYLDYGSLLVHNINVRSRVDDNVLGWNKKRRRLQHSISKKIPSALHFPGPGRREHLYNKYLEIALQSLPVCSVDPTKSQRSAEGNDLEASQQAMVATAAGDRVIASEGNREKIYGNVGEREGSVSFILSEDQGVVLQTTEPSPWLIFGFVGLFIILLLAAIAMLFVVCSLVWEAKKKAIGRSARSSTASQLQPRQNAHPFSV